MNDNTTLLQKEITQWKKKDYAVVTPKKTMLRPFYYLLLFKSIVVTTIKDVSTLFSFTVNYLQKMEL